MLQTVYDLCKSSMFTTTFPAKVSSSFFFSLGNLSLCDRRHGLSDENSARTQPKLFPLGEPWRRRLKTSRPARPLGVKKPGKRLRSIVPAITLGSPSVSNRIKTGDMIQFPFACQFGKAKVSLCFQEAVTGFRLSKVEENGAFCLQTVTLSISPFSAVSVILYSFLLCVVLFSFCFFFLLVTHVCLLVYRSSCHLKERHDRS